MIKAINKANTLSQSLCSSKAFNLRGIFPSCLLLLYAVVLWILCRNESLKQSLRNLPTRRLVVAFHLRMLTGDVATRLYLP